MVAAMLKSPEGAAILKVMVFPSQVTALSYRS